MKLAVDPHMLRRTPLLELPPLVAELGYQHIELSPREDFLPFFPHPRADRAIQITVDPVDLGCGVMKSELNGRPEQAAASEARFWRSPEELLPIFERHIADRSDHTGSSGLRYLANPPGSSARVHQYLDVGQGEVDRDLCFATLAEVGFDGTATICVFAWEERARESLRSHREKVQEDLGRHAMAGA